MTKAAPEPKTNMGEPFPRLEGRLKVTGKALYAADFPVANPAFAILVTSPIARGYIVSFDLAEARAVPGVLDIRKTSRGSRRWRSSATVAPRRRASNR